MEIILVRHGKAEGLRKASEDINRSLVDRGIEDIKRSMPVIKKWLQEKENIIIWSSPAARADQTARLIADDLEISEVNHFDFLWNGDFKSFTKQLKSVPDNTQLFVVGHEPYLSKWSRKFSEDELNFRKGMMAGYEVIQVEPLSATLKWTQKPRPSKTELNEKSKPELKVSEIKAILHEIISDLEEMLISQDDATDDMEFIHQIRVRIRHLKSIFSMIKGYLNSEDYRIYQDKLSVMARKFSYLRELDVVIDQWEALRKSNQYIQQESALSRVLWDERENERLSVREYISGKEMLYGLKDISEWIFGWSEEPNDDSRLSRNAVNKYEEWIRAIDNGLKTIDMNELSEIHALRLLIKKARYVQVRIKYFSNHKKWSASKLKDKQNDLGKLCDILNNVSLIRNLNSFEDRDSLEFEKGYLLGYQEFEKQMLVERHSEK